MATNLSIDPDLLERALEVSGERTKKAAVTKSLAGIHRAPAAEASAGTGRQARMGRELRLQGGARPRVSLFVDTSVWSLALRSANGLKKGIALYRAGVDGCIRLTGRARS
ncbi:MAG TPA: type II toxin-antitoxin system VapB family antitoxin [Bradyrhizobium sp.]|jgi:hypothetical protein|nr:type II toxin-antitoxin system VapB family antitoxin [Bradyrhizobium sp.]